METIVKIPEGVEVEIDKFKVRVKGKLGEVERDFYNRGVANILKFEKLDGEIKVIIDKEGVKGKALIGTIKKHILNLFKGVAEGFEYKLKVVYTHFPISVELKDNEFIVRNFLGQKDVKKTKIPGNVKIDISKDEIRVFSINKELAGQVAASLERLTKLSKKDRRKFQDGIFIYEKPK
jgi:large subunit ribosomal protein L6